MFDNPITAGLVYAYAIVTWLVAIKSIIGVHWPWERCDCCGRRYSEHAPNHTLDQDINSSEVERTRSEGEQVNEPDTPLCRRCGNIAYENELCWNCMDG